ncbi:hypothetical protein POM88_017786 [Heracleum sosnowskyi]|uniref:Protein FAR1-RELATED SEQUENCE n=1 Tax=Heracleum sosnowskyi TaxID=360622 RepID=A0AAD8IRC6_9APIA|nr:hypothetical protein POM88_017786 [Heracleum sosnowskyi]
MSFQFGSNCGDSSRTSTGISPIVSTDISSIGNEGSVTSYTKSPGGNMYYIPSSVGEIAIPFTHQVFESLDKGYKFYKDYGRLGGFSVQKTTEKRDDDGETILLKHYVCSREGFNDPKDDSGDKVVQRRQIASQRCGCKAKMVLKYMAGGQYFVFSFVELHNHPLASETGRQFFRVNREMNINLRNIVFDSSKVKIGCITSFSFAKELAGGYSNVGATLRDFRNFNRDLKTFVGENDGQMLIDKFKVNQENSKSFYFAYDVDSAGHLTKMFWADPIGRRYFELYGDAVSFDATFDTNKYNMIFAPFTGVDKHDKCVTFAACLLSQESIEDYTWAFDHFVKSKGRNPVVIITDQCTAMKKFPVKLGNPLCKETDFMEKMKNRIWSSNLEIHEFEEGWETIIKEFKLEGNKWLSDMYAIRSSWIPTYFRDGPMFGLLRTTSRSESENFFFGQFHKQGDNLYEFWIRFQTTMERQRNETARLDHESKCTTPTTIFTWYIKDDTADLFKRAIFYKFQEEIIRSCLDMQIKRMSEEVDGVTHLEISDVKVKDKIFKLIYEKISFGGGSAFDSFNPSQQYPGGYSSIAFA